MHSLVHDLMQAGKEFRTRESPSRQRQQEFRPSRAPDLVAPRQLSSRLLYTALPQITPGWQLGEDAKTVNPVTLAVQDGLLKTDIITILYVDDTLVSSALGPGGIPAPKLSDYPVVQAAPAAPVCAGALNAAGTTVTLAPACFTLARRTNAACEGRSDHVSQRQRQRSGISNQRRRGRPHLRRGRSGRAEWDGLAERHGYPIERGRHTHEHHPRLDGHLLRGFEYDSRSARN